MMSGLIFNIQKYSLNDGPGIRTTVFLKGCPLRCAWCHNPEGILHRCEIVVVESRCVGCEECRRACPFGDSVGGTGPLPARLAQCDQCGECVTACPTGARQMIGRVASVQDVMQEVVRDRVFYDSSGGGVTFSGGEPLMQPEFLLALLRACRDEGIQAVLDTTGFGCGEHLLAAAAFAELVLYDLKAFRMDRHQALTGVSNRSILENLKALDRVHHNIWIRLPVVPGFNDDLENLKQIADFVAQLSHITLVNLLPFHRTGLHKYERLGMTHQLDGVETPSVELMQRAVQVFEDAGLNAKVGG